jgi:two-component system cell cycle sensor histidine kinase/response regulator CckA
MALADGTVLEVSPEKLEEMLGRSQRLEMLGRMTGAIAHDFNNLLLIVFGATELARLATRDPRVEVELSRIEESSIRASGLVRQLLGFAKGKPADARRIRLGEVVSQLGRLLELALGRRSVLELTVAEDLWHVIADPGELEQVLLNLAINARDAMPSGGKFEITLRNLSLSGDGVPSAGDYVAIKVRDTGTGMDAATLERLFEPFFSTKSSGTGLGLATSRRLLERVGGTIQVQSRPNEGATFEILLPRAVSS